MSKSMSSSSLRELGFKRTDEQTMDSDWFRSDDTVDLRFEDGITVEDFWTEVERLFRARGRREVSDALGRLRDLLEW